MVKLSVRADSGAARSDVIVRADSLKQAVGVIGGRDHTGDVRVRSLTGLVGFSVDGSAAGGRALADRCTGGVRKAGGAMNVQGWYEALAAGLAVHRHTMMGGSEGEIESRIRALYEDAVAILVYAASKTKATKGETDLLSRRNADRRQGRHG